MSGDLRELLRGIYDQGGRLTPALVVDAARPVDSPLHHRFTWDDTVAGERWRQVEAAQLIRSCRIVYAEGPSPEGPRTVRAFTALRETDLPTCNYMPTAVALADDFAAKLILRDMEREWRNLQRRYGHMAEFADMIRRDSA